MSESPANEEIQAWIEYAEQSLWYSRDDIREDLLQEGWLSALQARETWKPEGYSLKNWIIMHCQRDMVRYLRRNDVYIKIPDNIDILIEETDQTDLMDTDFEQRALSEQQVQHLAANCSEREFNVLFRYYVEGMSEREIAVTENVSRSMIQKIRRRVVQNLGGINFE
jgi:RNA polymerase sigma factor (sigma-70 family)